MKEKFNEIKEKLLDIKDTITDWIDDNLTVVMISVGALIVMLVLFAIISLSSSKKKISAPTIQYAEEQNSFIPPLSSTLLEDYYFNREQKDQWSTEEVEQWFTPVTEKEIQDLSKANSRLIEELEGRAP